MARGPSQTMHEENKANMAALDQRVFGLENDVQALRADLSSGLSALRGDFVASFNQINAKLDTRDDRKWLVAPAIAFMMLILSIVGGLGTLSLSPVRERVVEIGGEVRSNERESVDRDRKLWDHYHKMRSEFDFLRGQLSPLPRP